MSEPRDDLAFAVQGRDDPVHWDRIEQIGEVLHTLNDWEVHLVTMLTLRVMDNRQQRRHRYARSRATQTDAARTGT